MQQLSFSKQIAAPLVRCIAALALLVTGLVVGASSCSSESNGPGPDNVCKGVDYHGTCEPKCNPEACLHSEPGVDPAFANKCVENKCQLECTSERDCANYNNANGYLQNTQDCLPGKEDGTNADLNICTSNNKARGFGYACPFRNECTTGADNMLGTADDPKLFACPDGSPCADACGDDPANACEADPLACRGKPDCAIGRCKNDQAPCNLAGTACPQDQCKPFGCLSTGEADADAYCTKFDCSADTDCPGGYWCGVVRDPRQICGKQKGNSGLCGMSTEPCVDLSKPENAGYAEGASCLEHHVCMKRKQCAPCESDIDCSQVDGQKCATTPGDGAKVCAKLCDKDTDCQPNELCDTSQGSNESAGSCIPRFGACKGTGQFCEPCRNDLDCGATATCYQPSLNGETGCFDFANGFSACTTDGNCPKSPSGKFGDCNSDSGSSLYHQCFYPFNAAKGKYGCW